MRVLHVVTRHRSGGAERNLRHSLSAEVARGFSVHVAVGTEDLVQNFPAAVEVFPMPELVRDPSPSRDSGGLRRLRRMIREHDFDVVHTHQSKAGVVGRLAALGGRRRVIVHTVHMASFGPGYSASQDFVFRGAERALAHRTDCWVFVGNDLRKRYVDVRAAHPDRSRVIRSPIFNLETLLALRVRSDLDRGLRRSAIGVPANRPVILAVGIFDRRKRTDLVIRALAPLLAGRQATLVIAGQGSERANLESLCCELGVSDAVFFTGFVDVLPLYAAADVFVQASKTEGVSQSILQAVAAGVPVITTKVDGVREVASGEPHVTLVPIDGTGLSDAVRARLCAPRPEPKSEAELEEWLPGRVDHQLASFHDWLERRVGSRLPR